MKTKKFDIGAVKIEMHSNGFPKGLCTKRDATLRECKHIMKNLLGIDTHDRDCFVDEQEYKEYNDNRVIDVNKWLRGDYEDHILMEDYAYDSYEPLGCMNLIPIIAYLKSKGIID